MVAEARLGNSPSLLVANNESAARGLPWYAMYGLRVASAISMPIAALPPVAGERPDLVIRRGDATTSPARDGALVAVSRCPVHGVDADVHRGPGGTWFWHREVAAYHVAPDYRRIDVYPEQAADERAVGILLAGLVVVYAVHQLGCPMLHASAVLTERGAAAFLGRQGQGKSTMAAACLRRGAALLADDALPLRIIDGAAYAGPSLPFMKVWRETATCALALDEELPNLTATYEKKLLTLDGRGAVATEAAPLRAIYLLDRYAPAAGEPAEITIRPVGGREALTALLAQTSNNAFLSPAEAARLIPFYARLLRAAPLRLLSYPSGFDRQQAVYDRLMTDLEGR
jgi:hypothetical protein